MSVELGFLEYSEPWEIESRFFPSKAGGKPAWLSLENVPSHEELKCGKCDQTMIFLCQVYAPFEDESAGEYNFHRTIFVFICKNAACSIRNDSSNVVAFRSCIPRVNKFYSSEAADEKPDPDSKLSKFVNLCNYCGCGAGKVCSQCRKVHYCCKEHQVKDWKEKHKAECKTGVISDNLSKILYSEWEIITETEQIDENSTPVDIEAELKKFEQMKVEGKTGTMNDVSEEDLDAHATTEKDKTFAKFKKRISANSDQVVRYDKGGMPLWIAKEPLPTEIPNCEYCGSDRQFEFQIMPQMLAILKENSVDFGIIAVYTCRQSCKGTNLYSYKKEFVFKQDVSLDNV